MLRIADTTKPFVVEVDACMTGGRGMGVVLIQDHGIIGYWSKALTEEEKVKYAATNVEARSMRDAIIYTGIRT